MKRVTGRHLAKKKEKKKIVALKKPPRRQSAETDFQMKKRFIFRKGRSAKIAAGRNGGTFFEIGIGGRAAAFRGL